MYKTAISVLLFIVGLINFLPIMGILSTEQLSKLYGIQLNDTNLIILLQHRALLFGIIGGFIMYAAFYPALQTLAIIAGFISMLGFVFITLKNNSYNAELARIVTLDIVALILLSIALILLIFKRT